MTSSALPQPVIGERLKEARRLRGISQEDAAEHLGVSRPTLVTIEQGRRAPRPAELVRLAAFYGRRVEELTRTSPPVVGLSAQFRMAEGERSGDAAAAVSDLQRLADDVVAVEALAGSPSPRRYPEPYDVDGLPLEAAAEQVAEAERQRLGLGDGPLARLREVLEDDVGLRVFAVPLPSRVAGLFSYAEPAGGCVAVNAHHPHERQRWTLAHEYEHFLTSRWSAEVTTLSGRRPSLPERRADAFAASFLMPSAGVIRRFQAVRRSRDDQQFRAADLLQLAATYEVSAEAMALRLEALRLIAGGWWTSLRSRGLRVDDARKELGVVAHQRDERPMPRRVEYLAVEAHLRDELSEGRLSTLLHQDRVAVRRLVRSLSASSDVDEDGSARELAWDLLTTNDAAAG